MARVGKEHLGDLIEGGGVINLEGRRTCNVRFCYISMHIDYKKQWTSV